MRHIAELKMADLFRPPGGGRQASTGRPRWKTSARIFFDNSATRYYRNRGTAGRRASRESHSFSSSKRINVELFRVPPRSRLRQVEVRPINQRKTKARMAKMSMISLLCGRNGPSRGSKSALLAVVSTHDTMMRWCGHDQSEQRHETSITYRWECMQGLKQQRDADCWVV